MSRDFAFLGVEILIEFDPKKIYVNLTSRGMIVCRDTAVVTEMKLGCGDVLWGIHRSIHPIVIEACELTPEEFRHFQRESAAESDAALAARYRLTVAQVESFRGERMSCA